MQGPAALRTFESVYTKDIVNLHNLKYVPENISILQYIIIRTAVKYAALAGIVVLIRLIAKKTRSHMQTMVISAVLFVAPILIMIILEGIRA